MKITDEAKEILNQGLAANNCDCLTATLQQSCCGSSVSFSLSNLTSEDKPEMVNGIPVIMDDEILKKVELVTLYAEDGELLFQDDAPHDDAPSTGCSSCSSCSSCS